MDEEFKIINSPLSRQVSHDGMTVEVQIYRGEKDEAWILEVVDQVRIPTKRATDSDRRRPSIPIDGGQGFR